MISWITLTFRTALGIEFILANYFSELRSRLQYETTRTQFKRCNALEGSGFNFEWDFTNTVTWKETFESHDLIGDL